MNEDYQIPTDRQSIIEVLERIGCPVTEESIAYETRVSELQNEGMTRGDAQGVAEYELGMY